MPTFCRHGRLEATCPICARKAREGQAAEPRRATPRPARLVLGALAVPRAAATCACAGWRAPPTTATSTSCCPDCAARSTPRAWPTRSPSRRRGWTSWPPTRPASTPRWRAPPTSRRPRGWPSSSPTSSPLEGEDPWASIAAGPHELGLRRAADARGRRARAARRARPRARGLDAAGLPRVGRSAPARRRRPSPATPRGPTSAASTAPSSACRCRASGAPPRYELLVDPRAPRRLRRPARGRCSSPPTRSTRPSSPPSACSASATRCCCSAARPSSSSAVGVPIEALDLGLTNWSRPEGERITAGATVGVPARCATRIGAALGV